MVNQNDLEQFAQAGPEAEPDDLLKVTLSGENPAERLESLLAQVKNPYYVRVGETPVHFIFHNEESPLESKLTAYFLALKGREPV